MSDSDISQLLNSSDLSSGSSANSLGLSFLAPLFIVGTIVSILIMVLWCVSLVQRWRVNHAILEIRDILKEMQPTRATPPPAAEPVKQPTVEAAPVPPDPELTNTNHSDDKDQLTK